MDTTLFTPIMVIGTIMALIFAAGALWNSLARRKSLSALAEDESEEEKFVFKPMPSPPSSNAKPGESTGTADPAARPSPPSTPLFRKIQPTGNVEEHFPGQDKEGAYVWE